MDSAYVNGHPAIVRVALLAGGIGG